jgi:membrane-associated protease RseP (regulator of RpoE activity)
MAWAVVRLLAVVAAGVVAAVLLHAVGVLVVVLALVAMVMAHELGHFLTAKWSDMKVTEYFFGFGPRLWSVRRGETEYGVKALPAGGYVKIVGMTTLEEVAPADEARSYREATFPRRVLVASAGSIVHFVLAFLLVWSAFVFVGWAHPVRPYIAGLLSFRGRETPAQLAGLRAGDQVVSIDGKTVAGINRLIDDVNASAGKNLTLVVERAGHYLTLHVRPVDGRKVTELDNGVAHRYSGRRPIGIIGVSLSDYANQRVNPLVAVGRSGGELGSLIATTGQSIAQVFSLHGLSNFAHDVATAGSRSSSSGAGTSAVASSSPTICSLVCAVQIGSQEAGQSIASLLLLLAEINLFVGLVNLFPMLPLDGGHVAIAVYERIRSRRGLRYHADVSKLLPVAYVFLAFIVLIGLGALYANIVQPTHLPGG